METITDKNKNNQHKATAEERTSARKQRSNHFEIDWRDVAINAGFTLLNGIAFAAGGMLLRAGVDRVQNRSKPTADLIPENVTPMKKQLVGHA